MRRLPVFLLCMVLAAAALFLAACGGDDNNNSTTSAQTPPPQTPTGPSGATGAKAGKQGSTKKKSARRKRKRSSGSSGGSSTAPKPKPQSSTPQNLKFSLEKAGTKSAQDQVSYSAALNVCKKRPMSEIRAVYKPKGKSADAIAKAVSSFYHPPHRAQAAYSGCLKGLSQR